MRKVYELLISSPEGLPAKDVLSHVAASVEMTPYEASEYPNHPGMRRFEKLVRFISIPHTKAGWLLKNKGTWTVSDPGKEAYERFTDPDQFQFKAAELYRKWRKDQPAAEPDDEEPETATTLEEAEENAWNEIVTYLGQMPPYEFQNLVAALLGAMGYHVSWISPPGADRGIDLVASLDPLGISSPRIKVQVKRHQERIAVDGVRSFMAVLSDEDVGIYVSAGGFTSDAEREVRSMNRKMTLIDLNRLFELWVEHYDSLDEEQKQLMPLRTVYYLAPRD
jgi:restriction system protein